MSDLIERLRRPQGFTGQIPHHQFIRLEAADEIERLRAERDEARAERDAMAKDAERYRFLSCKGVPPHSHRWSRWRLEYWNGEWWDPLMKEELDAAIDAQIEQERSDE